MNSLLKTFQFDSVAINVNNTCNLNCSYCFEKGKTREFMDGTTLGKILDLLSEAFNDKERQYMINIFGGEPTLSCERIEEILQFTKNRPNIRVGITTNLVEDYIGLKFKEYMNDYPNLNLLVSVDGTKTVHNRNRCDSYDRVVRNLKVIQDEIGLIEFQRRVEGRMTVTPNNVEHMQEGVQHLLETLHFTRVYPMLATDQDWTSTDLLAYLIHSNELFKYVIERFNNPKIVEEPIYVKNYTDVITEGRIPHGLFGNPEFCPIFSSNWCAFDVNGDVYPCHQFPTMKDKEQFRIGSLDRVTNKSLLDHPPKFGFPFEECKNCQVKSICHGGCPAENYRLTGSFVIPRRDIHCNLTWFYGESINYAYTYLYHKKYQELNTDVLRKLWDNIDVSSLINDLRNKVDLTDEELVQQKTESLNDAIESIGGEEMLLPEFKQYFEHILSLVTAFLLTEKMNNEEEEEDDNEEEDGDNEEVEVENRER